MRLRYEIEGKSSLTPDKITENIILQLKKSNFEFKIESGYVISFISNGWGPTAKQFDKVSGGLLKILDNGGERIVKFSYYVNITIDLTIMLVFTLFGFFIAHSLLFPAGIFILMFFIRLPVYKSKCQEMLGEVTTALS
jgi:hypothetical protein